MAESLARELCQQVLLPIGHPEKALSYVYHCKLVMCFFGKNWISINTVSPPITRGLFLLKHPHQRHCVVRPLRVRYEVTFISSTHLRISRRHWMFYSTMQNGITDENVVMQEASKTATTTQKISQVTVTSWKVECYYTFTHTHTHIYIYIYMYIYIYILL